MHAGGLSCGVALSKKLNGNKLRQNRKGKCKKHADLPHLHKKGSWKPIHEFVSPLYSSHLHQATNNQNKVVTQQTNDGYNSNDQQFEPSIDRLPYHNGDSAS
mmetsp:Transcript_8830/g.18843  ORF Transcript_8830/g.18843 Transcript_8830/m.18843 type:complete len:102 (-) Transcript_8830:309-614(-)